MICGPLLTRCSCLYERMHRFLLSSGPRPPSYPVARHLWGADCAYDSDGNSDHQDATDRTELTVNLRLRSGENDEQPRVDVDPLDGVVPLVLEIRSDDTELARKAAVFLKEKTGGTFI